MLTKKELGDVMMKLEEKCPMCWNFCIRTAVSTTHNKAFETHRKLMKKNT